MVINLIGHLFVFGLFIGVEEAIDVSEALYWGVEPLANGGRLGDGVDLLRIGERRPFWGATSILSDDILS